MICFHCKSEFTGRKRKFCSKECRCNWYLQNPVWIKKPIIKYTRICRCGAEFETTFASKIYCQKKCKPKNQYPYKKRYRKRNLEKERERARRYREKNPDAVKRWEDKRTEKRKQNPDIQAKRNSHSKSWRIKNPEKAKKNNEKHRLEITPAYISVMLHCKVSELTSEMIEQKRLQLKIKRLANEKQKQIKSPRSDGLPD